MDSNARALGKSGNCKSAQNSLHLFERLRVMHVGWIGHFLDETQAVLGQFFDFCTTEIFFFFLVGRNSANFAPARPPKLLAD
ncbi:MAG TPA: hypothetical protein VGK58_16805 [Lacipirellulaceae bacterium]